MSTDLAPAPTADDHRDQRRSDVLAAAEALLHERGCDAFSMREVAARAGVSAGATYQWFQGKDEIFAEIYTERLELGLVTIETRPFGMPFEDLVHQIFVWHQPLYRDLGCWATDFINAPTTDREAPHVAHLLDALQKLLQVGLGAVREAAAASDIQLIEHPMLGQLLWTSANAAAKRAQFFPDEVAADQYVKLAAHTFARGIVESS